MIRSSGLRVALFMSGSGTNAVKLLEYEQLLRNSVGSSFEVAVICTDNPNSKAFEIAKRFEVPAIHRDLQQFYTQEGKERRDLSVRPKYFERVLGDLKINQVDVIVLAGYMVLVTDPLFVSYPGKIINVHPADLSIRDPTSNRAILTGDAAVKKAILAGHTELRATTHIAVAEADQGSPLLISKPVNVVLPEGITLQELRRDENKQLAKQIASEHQNRLKIIGDWEILPLTVQYFADGRLRIPDNGVPSLFGNQIPNGYRLQ